MDVAPIPLTLSDIGDVASDPPASETVPPTRSLSSRQKAALIVRLLAADGSSVSLKALPDQMQADLIREVGALGPIDDATTSSVVEEFSGLLETAHLFGPGGLQRALEMLGGVVNPRVIERIRLQSGFTDDEDPWERIVEKETEQLLPILEGQSVEVAAVVLAKLPVGTSAALLGQLPGPHARSLAYALSRTSAVTPDAVERIGAAMARLLDIEPVRAFTDGPVERVGAILNSARSSTRTDVLAGLDETDAAFAEDVRRAIFTFGNIPERVDPRDIPKILRGVEQDVIIQALAAQVAEAKEAQDFILANISQRMADAFREEVEALGAVDEEVADDAMSAIVGEVRRLEDEGEIHLVAREAE